MTANITLVSNDRDYVLKSKGILESANLGISIYTHKDFVPNNLIQNRPNVILVDVVGRGPMEGLDIIEVMRCREHLRKIPIIALLSNASREIVLAVHQTGVKDIISKTADADSLLEKIQHYCPVTKAIPTPVNGARAVNGGNHTVPTLEWSDPATTAFKKQVRREVSKRLELLPSLPLVVMEIMRLVDDNNSSASDFEQHISHDQALAARILRIANSSFFAQSRTIKSIRDAIVILGFRTLKSLVMAATTSRILDRPAEGYGYAGGGLWKHSIGCAVGCRLLSRKLGHSENAAEEFFVLGLLHDIGKLLLTSFVSEKSTEFRDALTQRNLSLQDAEQMILGLNHCTVGNQIAEQWNLPIEVRNAVQYHHQPLRSSRFKEQVALVHVSNHLCHQMRIGMLPEPLEEDVLDIEAANLLGFTDDIREQFEIEFSTLMSDMEKLFALIGKE